jgi:predicted nucleic acid-binding protein
VIYLDTSVALAQLQVEDRVPAVEFWRQPMIASRLLEYEVWNRLHARKLGRSHAEEARVLIGRIALVELVPPVLARALEPFPLAVRTLDALHLATMDFLRSRGQIIELATYDDRLAAGARALGIGLATVQ